MLKNANIFWFFNPKLRTKTVIFCTVYQYPSRWPQTFLKNTFHNLKSVNQMQVLAVFKKIKKNVVFFCFFFDQCFLDQRSRSPLSFQQFNSTIFVFPIVFAGSSSCSTIAKLEAGDKVWLESGGHLSGQTYIRDHCSFNCHLIYT